MKKLLLIIFSLLIYKIGISQNCSGNACSVVSVRSHPTANIAWQFTNNSNTKVQLTLRLWGGFGGSCSNPSSFIINPHNQFNWGMGNQAYCAPFTANFIGAPTAAHPQPSQPLRNVVVVFKNNTSGI